MYRMGQPEIDAVARVIRTGAPFRYKEGQLSECERFERRYAQYLGVKHVALTASGTLALRAALVGVGVGPGDEVLVPACTYMATALAVLAVGAIPVVVDVDESITLDPKAFEKAIGPRTKAVIPVHMWGLPCDMKAIMRIAKKHKTLVVEDACQAVGGGYEGRKLGSIGHVGAFSFNYYKNICCGEGGAVVANDDVVMWRAQCVNECCRFYWDGRDPAKDIFASDGARASEFEGAILNAQLDRLDPMIRAMRRQKMRILRETEATGLRPICANSLEHECGTHVMYILPTSEAAAEFRRLTGGVIAAQTGRHVYAEWDPVLQHKGAHHPALNPYLMKENRNCRMNYSLDMCARSLDILGRTVMLRTHPDHKAADVTAQIRKIREAAKAAL
ncbi:MAG: DegT/DnrJ/EryC1/StrS family aminotransferase [Candidatus Sumerlaeota bacterium]|nr:DegT/DnrJ/EryC1/StrS family aminotransferase [Candidatus Sumerlaeota bacterium]